MNTQQNILLSGTTALASGLSNHHSTGTGTAESRVRADYYVVLVLPAAASGYYYCSPSEVTAAAAGSDTPGGGPCQ